VAAQQLPDTPVELAFLELTAPTLSEVVVRLVGAGAKRITIIPLFLAAGGHIKEDLPKLVAQLQQRYPGVSLTATVPIGEDEDLLAAIAAWVVKQRARGSSKTT
jgi:sirohydrochlorin cobaltochelatase